MCGHVSRLIHAFAWAGVLPSQYNHFSQFAGIGIVTVVNDSTDQSIARVLHHRWRGIVLSKKSIYGYYVDRALLVCLLTLLIIFYDSIGNSNAHHTTVPRQGNHYFMKTKFPFPLNNIPLPPEQCLLSGRE